MTLTLELDTTGATRALDALDRLLEVRLNEACRVTAQNVAREAQGRLARQLGPDATGETVRGIVAQPAKDGRGWVVLSDNARMPNLPLWLEKGTQPGKRKNYARTQPRPFFYTSLELEAPSHERRVTDAMRDSADESGLGG